MDGYVVAFIYLDMLRVDVASDHRSVDGYVFAVALDSLLSGKSYERTFFARARVCSHRVGGSRF